MSAAAVNDGTGPGRPTPPRTARRVGPWLLWFAVLGGSLAWAVHLFVAWGVAELACMDGNTEVLGLPLRGFVAVATGLPLAVALASTGVAWRIWHAPGEVDDDRAGERARFLAHVGFALNLFAVAATVFGAAALLVLEPCA